MLLTLFHNRCLTICPPLTLKVESVEPNLESHVTTDLRPGVIRLGSAIGKVLARYIRGPSSNPGRDMLFLFAFLVGCIYYLTCKHFLEMFIDILI